MMSPRSFIYYNQQRQQRTPPSSRSPSRTPPTSNPTVLAVAAANSVTAVSTSIKPATTTVSVAPVSTTVEKPTPSRTTKQATTVATTAPSPSSSPRLDRWKDDGLRGVKSKTNPVSVSITPLPTPADAMARSSKNRSGAPVAKQGPTSAPRQPLMDLSARPATPASPVQIPTGKSRRDNTHPPKRHHHHHQQKLDTAQRRSSRRPRDVHSPDAIPASVVALLAITDIPRRSSQKSLRARPVGDVRMTVDAIMARQQVTEKELSMRLGRLLDVDAHDDEEEMAQRDYSGPLQVLLSPPDEDLPEDVARRLAEEDDEDDDDDDEDETTSVSISVSDSGVGSALSTRTVSLESMPSLSGSYATDTMSSLDSPLSPERRRQRRPGRYRHSDAASLGHSHSSSNGSRGRKSLPTRPELQAVSSPPGQRPDHPLFSPAAELDVEALDFRVFEPSSTGDSINEERPDKQPTKEAPTAAVPTAASELFQLRPLKTAFKSNLTASLRALRSAARHISGLNLSSIPPDDFLTRSLLTIDPRVPYTDERRPPVLEGEPSPALRRYLNPTTNARLEPRSASAPPAAMAGSALSGSIAAAALPTSSYTASIQMQTYKVQRSMRVSSRTRNAKMGRYASPSPPTAIAQAQAHTQQSTTQQPYQPPRTAYGQTAFSYPPGVMRPRDLRENSDFIRVAVLELMMRHAGKLDETRPGRARMVLPPRRESARPYDVGSDGVPARWVAVSASNN